MAWRAKRRIIEDMAQVHMTEAEVVKDIQSVLEKVRQGAEIIVEQGDRTVAVIKPVKGPGRPIDECIALAKARESGATLDEDFAKDLEEIIASRQPLDPSVWE
jgi:antitoxin (DNA-binding transcriptional repressor) of toxin-antitoxin stability system